MLRRWGRRSELHFFGSKRRDRNFWEDLDGIDYDNQFIFDELAWNFEPSEMGAAFGLEQLKKLGGEPRSPATHLRSLHRVLLGARPTRSRCRASSTSSRRRGSATRWSSPRTRGFGRPDLQRFLDGRGIETRTIWTGNVARQPMLRGRTVRLPPDGLPNADVVMARGVLLPLSHAIDDDTLDFVLAQLAEFLDTAR